MSSAADQYKQDPGAHLSACHWSANGLEKPPHLRGNLSIARPHSTMSGQQLALKVFALDGGEEVEITDELVFENLAGEQKQFILKRHPDGSAWDSHLPSGGSIILRAPANNVMTIAKLSVTCNARNVEVYSKGDYLGLTRGALERDVMFVHNMEDHFPIDGTSEVSLKFLSLRPIKSGPVLLYDFRVDVGPLQKAPSPPEPMPGSNSMAMLMMMMGAAKGNQSQGQSRAPLPSAAQEEDTPPMGDTKKEESVDAPAPPPQLPDFAGLIMSQVGALLDQKLQPIMSKLNKVEATLVRLERQVAGQEKGNEEDDKDDELKVVVDSNEGGIDAGLESDLLALRQAMRASK